MSFSALRNLFGRPVVAVDLGTAEQRFHLPGQGLSFAENVTVHGTTSETSPRRTNTRIVRRGTLVDSKAVESMLRPILRKAGRFGVYPPSILACVPSGSTRTDRSLLSDACFRAGASRVTFTLDPLAGAVGSGMDLHSRHAQMVVDLGDGVTDIVAFRRGRVLKSSTVQLALSDLRGSIRGVIIRKHRFRIGPGTAESLLRRACSVSPGLEKQELFLVFGIDVDSGGDRHARVRRTDLDRAIHPALERLTAAVTDVVRSLPDDAGSELIENGITLVGGGASLPLLRQRIARSTGLELREAEDAVHAVIRGAARLAATLCQPGAPRDDVFDDWGDTVLSSARGAGRW